MYEMTVMDELSVLLAAALGFEDLTEGKDVRADYVGEWRRGKMSCFDALRKSIPNGGFYDSMAKAVIPMYLHDTIGATHYICYDSIKAISFNFPESNGANNCVIAEYDTEEGSKLDRLTFTVEFDRVEMLDSRHVNEKTVVTLAQYRTELDGILPAIEEFTGIRIPKCAHVGEWNPEYREWWNLWNDAVEHDNPESRQTFSDMSRAIKELFDSMGWQLYPAPGFTPDDECRRLEAIEEKKRRQLEHMREIERRV